MDAAHPSGRKGGEPETLFPLRRQMLERYRTEAGLSIDRLAQELMLPPPRVADLLDGRAILGNEIATHVEEMLGLPSS